MHKIKTNPTVYLALFFLLLGSLLRIYFFALNRSLWLDEIMLAVNLLDRSFARLFEPLDYSQGAPIGFLLLQKLVIHVFGSHDYVFRLIPLCAGLASLPLMYTVATQYGTVWTALVSFGLFALSPRLIYYSSELKQYSTDVLVALVLLFVAHKCLVHPNPRKLVLLGIAGALVVWLSHPALFVIAAIFLALGLDLLQKKDTRRLLWLATSGAICGVSLVLCYLISLQGLAANHTLLDYWRHSFAPMPPWSNLNWYHKAFLDVLQDPAQLPANAISLALLGLGVFSLGFRKWPLALILTLPIILTLFASALGKYPFNGRLVLFLAPFLWLLIIEGIAWVHLALLKKNKYIALLLPVLLVLCTFYQPVTVNLQNLQSPSQREHIRPVLAYLDTHKSDNDLIYVYYGARLAFEFYAPRYGLDNSEHFLGSAFRHDPNQYLQEIESLGSRRIWFVFSHNCYWCLVNEQDFILAYLDKIGQKKHKFVASEASVYLYDLTPPLKTIILDKQLQHHPVICQNQTESPHTFF